MRADRLLSALLLLQAHGKMSGRLLAQRLSVSQRTVHRDMEALSAAGVPVFALRGAAGGWQLDDGWRTSVPGLNEQELSALLMAQPRVIGDAGLVRAAEGAFAKLLAALPASLRERAASMRQRLYVDPTGWRGGSEQVGALPIVQEAVAQDRVVTITYRQSNRERVERTIEPLGLVAKRTTWYLVGRTEAGLRTYRVSRIEQIVMREQRFVRPPGFDLEAYWKESTAQFADRARFVATLRFEAKTAATVCTWFDVLREPEPHADADGWTVMRVRFDSEGEACFAALGFGPRAEVLEPASLKARVADDLAAAFARLRGTRQGRRRAAPAVRQSPR
jgi:predicted DNA-binding transcriptional regulator YafY